MIYTITGTVEGVVFTIPDTPFSAKAMFVQIPITRTIERRNPNTALVTVLRETAQAHGLVIPRWMSKPVVASKSDETRGIEEDRIRLKPVVVPRRVIETWRHQGKSEVEIKEIKTRLATPSHLVAGSSRKGCDVEQCPRLHKAQGLCDLHYMRARRHTARNSHAITLAEAVSLVKNKGRQNADA